MQSISEKKPGELTCLSQEEVKVEKEQRMPPVFEDIGTGRVWFGAKTAYSLPLLNLRCLFVVAIVKAQSG